MDEDFPPGIAPDEADTGIGVIGDNGPSRRRCRLSPRAWRCRGRQRPNPECRILRGFSKLAAIFGAACMTGAMRAAIHCAAHFDTMSDDLTIAVGAGRCHCVDRAFEAVESHRAATLAHLKRLYHNRCRKRRTWAWESPLANRVEQTLRSSAFL